MTENSQTDEQRALDILTRFAGDEMNYIDENGVLDGHVPRFTPEDWELLDRLHRPGPDQPETDAEADSQKRQHRA